MNLVLESDNLNLFNLMVSKRPTLFNTYERMYFENPINNVKYGKHYWKYHTGCSPVFNYIINVEQYPQHQYYKWISQHSKH